MTIMLRQTDLFDAPPMPSRRVRLLIARELRRLARQRAALTPAGQDQWGVTADDTHVIALRYGAVTGAERAQRATAWYATIPRLARLRNSGRRRPGRNRNAHTIYVI
jgi:hypothetical protein